MIGMVDWYRPVGTILLTATMLANILQASSPSVKRFVRMLPLLLALVLGYSQTTKLAVTISERVFETSIRGPSERLGGYLLAGLNPESRGQLSTEDSQTIIKTYAEFGDDTVGARKYLIDLTFSRLDAQLFVKLVKEKFLLLWSDHDALFDYGLMGSDDKDFINWTRDFEAILWIAVTLFMMYNAYVSLRAPLNMGVFSIQLFFLGFAMLLLLVEVQNRYVAVTIPYSILLAAIGAEQFFADMSNKRAYN